MNDKDEDEDDDETYPSPPTSCSSIPTPAGSAWSNTVSRTLDTLGNKSHMPASKMDDDAKRAYVDMVMDRGRLKGLGGGREGGKEEEKKKEEEIINFRLPTVKTGDGEEERDGTTPPTGTTVDSHIVPITPEDSLIPPMSMSPSEPPKDVRKMDLSERLEMAAIAEEERLGEIRRIREEQEVRNRRREPPSRATLAMTTRQRKAGGENEHTRAISVSDKRPHRD